MTTVMITETLKSRMYETRKRASCSCWASPREGTSDSSGKALCAFSRAASSWPRRLAFSARSCFASALAPSSSLLNRSRFLAWALLFCSLLRSFFSSSESRARFRRTGTTSSSEERDTELGLESDEVTDDPLEMEPFREMDPMEGEAQFNPLNRGSWVDGW